MGEIFAESGNLFFSLLRKVAPDINHTEFYWRASCVVGAFTFAESYTDRLTRFIDEDLSDIDWAEASNCVVRFLGLGHARPGGAEQRGKKKEAEPAPSRLQAYRSPRYKKERGRMTTIVYRRHRRLRPHGDRSVAGAPAPAELILTTRNPPALAKLAARGAHVRYADFDKPETLASGLRRRRPHAPHQHPERGPPRHPAPQRHRRRREGRRRTHRLHQQRRRQPRPTPPS